MKVHLGRQTWKCLTSTSARALLLHCKPTHRFSRLDRPQRPAPTLSGGGVKRARQAGRQAAGADALELTASGEPAVQREGGAWSSTGSGRAG